MQAKPRNTVAVAAAALLGAAASFVSQAWADEPKTAIYTGVDVAPDDSVAIWSGSIYAFNGLGQSGVVLRTFGGHAWYEYTSGAGFGEIDGDLSVANALIGYQVVQSNVRAALSIGVDYQDHDLSPNDPSNPIRGSETGFHGPW